MPLLPTRLEAVVMKFFFRSAISSDGETFNIRGKNTSGATFTVTIDNITIQKINGNTGTLS